MSGADDSSACFVLLRISRISNDSEMPPGAAGPDSIARVVRRLRHALATETHTDDPGGNLTDADRQARPPRPSSYCRPAKPRAKSAHCSRLLVRRRLLLDSLPNEWPKAEGLMDFPLDDFVTCLTFDTERVRIG
jgi:hypothetical protein